MVVRLKQRKTTEISKEIPLHQGQHRRGFFWRSARVRARPPDCRMLQVKKEKCQAALHADPLASNETSVHLLLFTRFCFVSPVRHEVTHVHDRHHTQLQLVPPVNGKSTPLRQKTLQLVFFGRGREFDKTRRRDDEKGRYRRCQQKVTAPTIHTRRVLAPYIKRERATATTTTTSTHTHKNIAGNQSTIKTSALSTTQAFLVPVPSL